MELESGYEILSRDAFDNVSIKYTLSTIPNNDWTTIFNKRAKSILASSIKNTTSIIVIRQYSEFVSNEIKLRNTLNDIITFTNNELVYESEKMSIILQEFIPGMILLHSREHLSYNSNTLYGGVDSDYAHYVKLIKERIINL